MRKIVAPAERTYPLELNYPMKLEKRIRIHLPDGWTAVLPPDYALSTNFAAMQRQYNQNENIIFYRLTCTLNQRTIPVTSYSDAKVFFNQLASEDRSRLLLNTIDRDVSSTTAP